MAAFLPFQRAGVSGFLHPPSGTGDQGLVLTHGAGGNCRAPLLLTTAEAFSAAGLAVLRCDLPFRQRRPSGPPSPASAAADRAGLGEAVAALRSVVPGKVYLGGQSYGGRQATLLAADEPDLVSALLLFSYPLHPPGKPDRLRTEHFPRLRVPALFVQGTADPFGSIAELRAAILLIRRRRVSCRSKALDTICGAAASISRQWSRPFSKCLKRDRTSSHSSRRTGRAGRRTGAPACG